MNANARAKIGTAKQGRFFASLNWECSFSEQGSCDGGNNNDVITSHILAVLAPTEDSIAHAHQNHGHVGPDKAHPHL